MAPSKPQRIAGWIITVLLALLFFFSASFKVVSSPEAAEQFQKMGFTPELMHKIGILEILIAIVYLIPKTSFIGAILLTGYMGGAIVTHLRAAELPTLQVIFAILIWVGLGLRQPEIFSLAMGKRSPAA